MDTTTGISAPPIGIISKNPMRNVAANSAQIIQGSVPPDFIIMPIKTAITRASTILMRCLAGNMIGAPLIFPLSFAKAMTEPENVIAPIAAPRPSSSNEPALIRPSDKIPKSPGLKKAATATRTAAKPTSDKENSGNRIEDRCEISRKSWHVYFAFFLYIASMRWVTRKPPKIFTAQSATAAKPVQVEIPEPPLTPAATAIRAPTIITDEMALVTAMRGVWALRLRHFRRAPQPDQPEQSLAALYRASPL